MRVNSFSLRSCDESIPYMSLVVQLVVGEFELVEADHLPHPGVSRGQRVRVDVGPRGDGGVCVSRHHPLGAVVHVPGRRGKLASKHTYKNSLIDFG